MSTYTMTLAEALEADPDIVDVSLAEYPIFDEKYRDKLNKKIVDHYHNREIGMETVSMFRLALRRRMNEIMPLYNQHYLASQLKFDPLSTIDIKTVASSSMTGDSESDSTTDAKGTSETLSKSDAKSRATSSDFPQQRLSANGDYATAMQDNISGTTATGKADDVQTSKNAEKSVAKQDTEAENTVHGYQGNPALLIAAYRESMVNVDMMVIDELQDCFMLIWSTLDSYNGRAFGYEHYYGL